MNTQTQVTLPRLRRAKQGRYNPISSISDPSQIATKLDAFEVGHLKDVVNIWDTLEQRDDLIRAVVSKRKKAAGRQGWTVLIRDSVGPEQRAEAEEHAAALRHFYENLRCENALDRAERGGFKLLARQMMDAVGKRFAVHEIVWRTPDESRFDGESLPEMTNDQILMTKQCPNSSMSNTGKTARSEITPYLGNEEDEGMYGLRNADRGMRIEAPGRAEENQSLAVTCALSSGSTATGRDDAQPKGLRLQDGVGNGVGNRNFVTARFRFVPLSFFENTTGSLRFLESESAVTGTELEPGAWMVTVGEGLMMATASAWILKNMTVNDWLLYAERNGRPGLRAITAAAPESAEWNALETTLSDILNGSAVIHSSTDDIKVIDLAAGGQIPFPDLVDRIDRMIAALWRGADLSTLSRERGYGASLQEKETCTLEEDDAEMLTETLNEYVDQWVIRYVFGEGVKPLANVKVLVSPKECTTADIQIDEFLVRNGALLSVQETMSRYGRAVAKNGERVLKPIDKFVAGDVPGGMARAMTNDQALMTKEFQSSNDQMDARLTTNGRRSTNRFNRGWR